MQGVNTRDLETPLGVLVGTRLLEVVAALRPGALIAGRTAVLGARPMADNLRLQLHPTDELASDSRRRRGGADLQYVQAVSRFVVIARRYGFDALISIAAVESMLEVALRDDALKGPRTTLWFAVPAIGLVVLPLLARRWFPFGAAAAVWLLASAVSLVDGRLVVFTVSTSIAGMISAFLLGNLRDGMQERLGLLIALAGAGVVVYNDPTHSSGELVFIPVLFLISWLAGFALQERTEQAEAADVRATRAELEREAAARLAVAEERARIARELHDIVAHSVSVMVLQVGAVRHRLPATLAEDRDALEGVEQAGRGALAEMRRLLGAMRSDGEELELAPQPGLGRLEALAAEVGRAGLPVRVHVDGEAVSLPRAIDLSAYRIVQEGLTNALKHARASQADVTVRYGQDDVQLEVRDNGVGLSASDGLGHGLVGIRERVKIYGGEMSAGPAATGGFLLSARLPLGRERR